MKTVTIQIFGKKKKAVVRREILMKDSKKRTLIARKKIVNPQTLKEYMLEISVNGEKNYFFDGEGKLFSAKAEIYPPMAVDPIYIYDLFRKEISYKREYSQTKPFFNERELNYLQKVGHRLMRAIFCLSDEEFEKIALDVYGRCF